MQTLTYCNAKITSTRTAVGQFKGQFNGAMEDMSGKVENASTHALQCQSSEHAHTAVGQFKGQFSGAMEEMSQTVQNANTHILRSQNHEHAHSSRSVQGSVQWGDGGHI